MRKYCKIKYKSNKKFQTDVRGYSHMKYKRNTLFRKKMNENNKTKYRQNRTVRFNKIERSSEKRATLNNKQIEIDFVIGRFRQEVTRGPEYVCSVCHRLFFKKQVLERKRECYERKGAEVATLANRCITLQYLHICDMECEQRCHLSDSPSSKLWICHTCHRKILFPVTPEKVFSGDLSRKTARDKCCQQHASV